MKIELATAHQILVELSEADLRAFDLTAERLTPKSENTRRVLQRILSEIADQTGVQYRLRQYSHLDVLPDRVGGCLLILSDCERADEAGASGCFFAREENAVIDAARAAAFAQEAQLPATLMKTPGGYLLCLRRVPARLRRLLCEFMEPVPLCENAVSALAERGTLLLREQPLSALGGGA